MILSASSLLCLALLHFLWQAAVVGALTLPLGALARRFSASAQYLVLCVGLLALPLVFAATLVWLLQTSPPDGATVLLMSDAAAAEPMSDDQALLFLLSDAPVAGDQAPSPAAVAWRTAPPLIAVLYLLAVAAMSLRLLLGLSGARRLVRESAAIHDERMLEFVAEQCRRLDLYTVPVVAYCRDVAVPTVIGVLRPTILLPLAATTGMTTQEIETILTHELVHIRRRDHLCVLLQRLLEAAFFFHPVVWLLSRRISEVREHSCDDRVISLGIDRQVYVESLLRAAELSLFGPAVRPTSSLAIALSAVDQPSRLRERILRLVNQPTPTTFKLRPAALAVAIGLMLVTIATPLAVQSFAQPPAQVAAEVKNSSPKTGNSDGGISGSQPQPDEGSILLDGLNRLEVLDPVHTDDLRVLVGWTEAPREGASKFRGQLGSQFELEVTGNSSGAVWGSDVYTDDSDLGAAAVHAGLLKPGETGTLIVTIVKSPSKHVGSSRNGVASRDYGTFGGSFMLHRPVQAARRPNTTAEEASRAIGVLDRLTEEKWSQLAVDEAQINTEVARANAALAHLFLEEEAQSHSQDINAKLSRLHGLNTTDCRSCHAVSTTAVTNATSFRGKLGRQFDVEIVGGTEGSVWGTDIYTDDSNIAAAAVHTGIVKPGERAIVTVTMVESPEEHVASERNGVKSGSWGSYSSSYILMRKSQAARTMARPTSPATASGFSGKLGRRFDVEIIGQSDGYVWGTDVYTDDSNIATAAVHAGLVKPNERAIVTLTIVESPEQHRGTTRNGVTTRDYGRFRSSFILQRPTQDSSAQPWHNKRHSRLGWSAGAADPARSPLGLKIETHDYELSPDVQAVPAAPEAAIELVRSLRLPAEIRITKSRQPPSGANAVVLRGEFGSQLDVEIVGRTKGNVWGSEVYTDDSDIPTAAVHAGLLKPGEKGTITITIVKSPEQYAGSTRNGVTSAAWGSGHPSGYILQRRKEAESGPASSPTAPGPIRPTY